jgi:hypothetical protein
MNPPMEHLDQKDSLRIPCRFAYCFWDVDLTSLRMENLPFAIARLYERGGKEGIAYVEMTFPKTEILRSIKTRRDFSPKTAEFLRERYHLPKEDMVYYRLGGGKDWKRND